MCSSDLPQFDRTHKGTRVGGTVSKRNEITIQELGMWDIPRVLHLMDTEGTFHLHVHQSQSRIDYVLISNALVSEKILADIGTISVSDHAPTHRTTETREPPPWRMHPSLLRDFLERS